jgi:HSP20 family molecular chaperone IbpA
MYIYLNKKVNVSLKDREIIIKAEDKKTRADGESSFQFYQRSTLPPGTDLNQLKATLNNNRLSVHAPINNSGDNRSSFRQVPVDGYGPRSINY